MDTTNNTGLSAYVPPKKWDELTDSEKIERSREEIKRLQGYVSRLQGDVHDLKEAFKKHSHINNAVVVPFKENYGSGVGIAGESLTQNYF